MAVAPALHTEISKGVEVDHKGLLARSGQRQKPRRHCRDFPKKLKASRTKNYHKLPRHHRGTNPGITKPKDLRIRATRN